MAPHIAIFYRAAVKYSGLSSVVAFFFLLFSSCTSQPLAGPSIGVEQNEIVIIATSDFHAALDRAEGLAQTIRGLRETYGNHVLHLDAGDLFQGSIEGNMSKGKAVVDFYNLLKVDAAAIGNHELDYGAKNLKTRVKEAQFDWISANFISSRTGRPIFKPHASFERLGRKICVIGATTPETPDITFPEFIKNTHFEALETSVLREAQLLRNQRHCAAVILTVHAGLSCDLKGRCLNDTNQAEVLHLLQKLPQGTLDAVVAGHTHVPAQEVVNGTPVIEAASSAKMVGVLHLFLDGKFRFDPFITVPANGIDASVTQLLKPYRERAQAKKSKLVGKTSEAFKKSYLFENALGNLVADALLETAKEHGPADFALINAGGLRADLPRGAVTYGDVYSVLPFNNSLAIVTLSGSQLRELLGIALGGSHGASPISGLRAKALRRSTPEGNLLTEVTDEQNQPIDDKKLYRLATIDFLTVGGDHQKPIYDKIKARSTPGNKIQIFRGLWIRDLLIQYLALHPQVSPRSYYQEEHPRVNYH